MIDYTIHYYSGHSEEVAYAGKKDLIATHFDGSEEIFRKKVKLLTYTTGDMFISEDVASGVKDPTITTADVNPYGWRNETGE